MQDFKAYGLSEMAIGNTAKVRAFVSLALSIVAQVEAWETDSKPRAKALCLSDLSIALTLAKTTETTLRRVLATVGGLVQQFGKDSRKTLTLIKALPDDTSPADCVAYLVGDLTALGATSLGFVEAYATKGKAGLNAAIASADTKAAAAIAKAAQTEAEAAAEAEADAAEAASKALDATPEAKAGKQGAAILASLEKHGQLMSTEVLQAIAAKVAADLLIRLSVAAEKRDADIAAAKQAKIDAAKEARFEKAQAAALRKAG